jgi:adenylosuccinate synthase
MKIIIGLGFGDEGKGHITSYHVNKSNHPLVCRFNGGHQAGHTVVIGGLHHIFSSFGSGTLQGAPTFWSRFCTVYPIALMNEHIVLKSKGITPKLYIDPLCPVTTPFDIMENHQQELKKQHGSVGVGFGQTIKRHEVDNFCIFVEDLFNPIVLRTKIELLKNYYRQNYFPFPSPENWSLREQYFFEAVDYLKQCKVFECKDSSILKRYDVIFEGAQGIMLDQTHGFFPHVTRSNTTCKNAMQLIKELDLGIPEIVYVTRTYQTRHGLGPLSNEAITPTLTNTELETNKTETWQGKFRLGILDLDLLKYAIRVDALYHQLPTTSENISIAITCIDQTGLRISATENSIPIQIDVEDLKCKFFNDNISFKNILYSFGSNLESIKT